MGFVAEEAAQAVGDFVDGEADGGDEIGGKAVGPVEAAGPEEDDGVDGWLEVVEEELGGDGVGEVDGVGIGSGGAGGDEGLDI